MLYEKSNKKIYSTHAIQCNVYISLLTLFCNRFDLVARVSNRIFSVKSQFCFLLGFCNINTLFRQPTLYGDQHLICNIFWYIKILVFASSSADPFLSVFLTLLLILLDFDSPEHRRKTRQKGRIDARRMLSTILF